MNVDMKLILSSPKTTDDQLREYMNKTHEINRLIAAHPSASSETLAELIEFWGESDEGKDLETCRLVVKNPNTGLGILLSRGGEFPNSLLENPRLEELLSEDPSILDAFPEVLAAPTCPSNLMERAISDSGLKKKAWLLLNKNLPRDIKEKLSLDVLNNQSSDNLDAFIEVIKDPKLKTYLMSYKETHRNFCIPRFVEFNRENELHRKRDQVLSGFPFTSNRWPWPIGGNGRYMQPIVQLDLKNSGDLLSKDFGSGLLQIWGGVDSIEIVNRTIPVADLNDAMDNFYPDDAPWLSVDMFGDAEMDSCMVSPFTISNYRPFSFDRCGIEWVPFANMYYPSLTKRVLYPLPEDSELSDFDEKLERRLENLDEKLNGVEIPTGLYPGISLLCRLGGYADGLGNTWETFSDPLLFYHSIDTGVKVTIGVTYRKSKTGEMEFHADYVCDN